MGRFWEICTQNLWYEPPLIEGSKASDFERYELDDDCSQNTNSESRSAFRMVRLLSLGGAISRRFPVLFSLKALIIQKRLELDEKCLEDTYSNSGSADRLVMLLQQFGATYYWFPFPVRFATFKSADISETVKAGWDVSKDHEYETKIDLSIGQVVSARWRDVPPVPANDLFSRLLKALITWKR
jgi:hypothetical protein